MVNMKGEMSSCDTVSNWLNKNINLKKNTNLIRHPNKALDFVSSLEARISKHTAAVLVFIDIFRRHQCIKNLLGRTILVV